MKCEQIQPNLLDYSRGTLRISEKAEICDHLKTCKECSAILVEEMTLDAIFKSVPMEEPTRDLWTSVASRVSSSKLGILHRLHFIVGMRVVRAVGAVAVTAALLAAITAGLRPVEPRLNDFSTPNQNLTASNVSIKWTDDPAGDSSDAMLKYIDDM